MRPVPTPPPDALRWSLECTPATGSLTMAQRRGFRLWLVAHNAGSAPIDTHRDTLEWLVNGRPSMELSMAFGNGVREQLWSSLPAGRTVREAREGGSWLLPRPGQYVFSIRMNGREVARRVVTVR